MSKKDSQFPFEVVPSSDATLPDPVPRKELKDVAEAVWKLRSGEAVRILEFGPQHQRLWDRNELKATIVKYFGWREGQTIAFRGEGRVVDHPKVVRIRWKSSRPPVWIQRIISETKDLGDAPPAIVDPVSGARRVGDEHQEGGAA